MLCYAMLKIHQNTQNKGKKPKKDIRNRYILRDPHIHTYKIHKVTKLEVS